MSGTVQQDILPQEREHMLATLRRARNTLRLRRCWRRRRNALTRTIRPQDRDHGPTAYIPMNA